MNIAPLRIGCLAHEAIALAHEGRVVSTFPHAANILLDGGFLITLLPLHVPMHPWAIGPVCGLASLFVGEQAQVDSQRLVVNSMVIDLSDAEIANLAITTRLAKPCSAAILDHLEFWVKSGSAPDAPHAIGAQERIEKALGSFSSAGDVDLLASVVGTGEGLTPSGDDVILGVLAALDFVSSLDSQARLIRQRLIHQLSQRLERQTSLISVQMLRAAFVGQYPEPIVALTYALSKQNVSSGDIDHATAELCAIGHRSGLDILRGIVTTLRWATPTTTPVFT